MKPNELRRVISWLMKRLTNTVFKGVENIPLTGGLLIATNHMSRMDIPVLFLTPNRPDMTALVTTKYLKYPLLRWFIVTARGIWLDRDTADFGAFRTAVDALNKGVAIGIAPEGTRSETASLLEAKPGTVLLALRAGVPILPAAITGTEDSVRKMLRFQKPYITAEFGPIIPAPVLDRDHRSEQLQTLTDELMCQIAVMMPEKYHGFYKDHPRLKELLAQRAFPPVPTGPPGDL
jgi:1-acyl-sn-glycerol-3-phosphate acyltransferase